MIKKPNLFKKSKNVKHRNRHLGGLLNNSSRYLHTFNNFHFKAANDEIIPIDLNPMLNLSKLVFTSKEVTPIRINKSEHIRGSLYHSLDFGRNLSYQDFSNMRSYHPSEELSLEELDDFQTLNKNNNLSYSYEKDDEKSIFPLSF